MVAAVATRALCRGFPEGPPRPPEHGRPRLLGVLRTPLADASATSEYLPALDLTGVFTAWSFEPVPIVLVAWFGGLYLLGVRRLRARGDAWSPARTLSFVGIGLGSFLFATSSGLGTYDTTLLSVHMVQHMILSMLVPLALALGAPVTLALRTLPGSPRRWLLAVLHSRLATVLTFPPLVLAAYVVSPWALYYSGWYPATLESTYWHEAMHLHLVLVGAMFFWPLMGIDPVPGRVGYPFRVLITVLTLPFHAFLGVTIMGQETLIAGEHYLALREGPMGAWLPDALDDQHLAGGILWGSGDLIGLVFFGVLFTQWVRSSMAEARREDRRLDRLEAQEAARAARVPAE
ncbi:MAG: cytochrome C oxidase assembly protein [Nocardioides sp.]|nr:cytochrome C oxidase assembly protein [Nocardioides sp.]